MKTRTVFSFLTAAVMTAASLPVLSGFAAETSAVLGDVDQDGYITGHDSAMVSRYLNVDSSMFTDEQLALADMNQDGIIDQTDADLIHAAEVVGIGDVENRGYGPTSSGALRALRILSIEYAGGSIEIVPTEDINSTEYTTGFDLAWNVIDQAHYNLLDANGDGELTWVDVDTILHSYSMSMASFDPVYGEGFYSEGRYDLYDGGYMDVSGSYTNRGTKQQWDALITG